MGRGAQALSTLPRPRADGTRAGHESHADVKSLLALYQYGRVHGWVRLRWGFLDETIPAPWVHRDEPTLYGLMKRAHEHRAPLEVVVGNAPGWSDPWARAEPAFVEKDEDGWQLWLVDDLRYRPARSYYFAARERQ